jgi:hypothetical protein
VISSDQKDIINRLIYFLDESAYLQALEDFFRIFETDDGVAISRKLIHEAVIERNANDLAKSVILAQGFIEEGEVLELQIPLLREDWHYLHEDIVFEMSQHTKPEYVDCYLKMIEWTPSHLVWDPARALAVKAIWGLGKTLTSQAEAILQELAESPEEVISRNAKEQLIRRNEQNQST